MSSFITLFPNRQELIEIGPLAIRYYALAYITGILAGWRYLYHLAELPIWGKLRPLTRPQADDFLLWATLGVILGGRIGYILFYDWPVYRNDPMEMLRVWHGGMASHGGFAGVILAIVLYARSQKMNWLTLGDMVVCCVPIGLFFGRLANFNNGELWGRVTDVPWGMVFAGAGPLPRHPSQLYEAALEGAALFLILAWLAHRTRAFLRPGLTGGVFLAGYGAARIFVECFREPDAQVGYLWGGLTMGQILSVPVVLAGLALVAYALNKPAVRGDVAA